MNKKRIDHDAWDRIRKRLKGLLFDHYQKMFDPFEFSDNSPVIGSLSDDLADIDKDLKPALTAYEKGQKMKAEDDIQKNFEIHWSDHAVSALMAMRRYFEANVWGPR